MIELRIPLKLRARRPGPSDPTHAVVHAQAVLEFCRRRAGGLASLITD